MKNIISLLLIVLAVCTGFFYIKPEYDKISGIRAQKQNYDNAIGQAKQVKALSDNLLQKYNSISDSDKNKLEAMVPSKFDLIKFTADISAMASKHGLVIKSVKLMDKDQSSSSQSIVAEPVSQQYRTILVSLSFSGTYPNFVSFLKDLETNTELVDLKTLSIVAGGESIGSLGFNILVNTYSIK
jgi:Tfp pilus assembly protein PilO